MINKTPRGLLNFYYENIFEIEASFKKEHQAKIKKLRLKKLDYFTHPFPDPPRSL